MLASSQTNGRSRWSNPIVIVAAVLIFVSAACIASAQDFSAAQTEQLKNCDSYEVEVTTSPSPLQLRYQVAAFHKLAQNIPKQSDVLVIGDSQAALWPPELLQDTFVGQSVFNFGIKGDKTQGVLWRLENTDLSLLKPKVILLQIGGNNLRDSSDCGIAAGVNEVIKKLHDEWPDAKMIFLEIPPRGGGFLGTNEKRKSANMMIAGSWNSQEWFRSSNLDQDLTCNLLQDSTPQIRVKQPTISPCNNYQNDHIHLTSSGYEMLGRSIKALWPTLN